MTGRIKNLVKHKGYGFIRYPGGDVFFHFTEVDVETVFEEMFIGQPVSFEIDAEGERTRAYAVAAMDQPQHVSDRSQQ